MVEGRAEREKIENEIESSRKEISNVQFKIQFFQNKQTTSDSSESVRSPQQRLIANTRLVLLSILPLAILLPDSLDTTGLTGLMAFVFVV